MRVAAEHDGPASGAAQSRLANRLTLSGLALALGLLALGLAMLMDARRDAWRQAERASSNLALALERDISRTFAVYDLSLIGALDALEIPGMAGTSADIRQAALFDRAASADYLGSLLVLDSAGNVAADSTSTVPHTLNLADRDYFTVHRDQPDTGLFVSRPFRSRLRNGDPSIAISRRVSNPDGTFAGIVVGTLRLAYFNALFERLEVGAGGAITLMDSNGRIVARRPSHADDFERDLSQSETNRRFATQRTGQFTAPSSVDGVKRLFTYRGIGRLPLLINVAVSVDGIYQAWWRKAVVIGSILGVLSAFMAALFLMFRREMMLRLRAEQSLLAAAARLQVMAATDPLTGLANRRAFIEGMDEAWREATRAQASLALVILDADHFKGYNDTYGHPEGDRVLQAVAACVRRCATLPGALAVRYGGEEFALLLPGADASVALSTAERLRNAVLALGIPHRSAPAGVVSVSVGVAVALPRFGEAAKLLVREADAALYEAKNAGRNRVAIAGSGEKTALA